MKNKDNRPEQAADLRRRAEKIALKKAGQSSEILVPLSLEEARRMLYELQLHQVELEMQNEELLRAHAELEAARARYFGLYDLAPVGYCTLSEKGLILEANLTAADMLGVARSALIKKPITRFIRKEDQDIHYHHRNKLFETGMPQNCELRMLRPNGALFWAQLDSTAVNDAKDAPVCRVVIIDITEHRQADEELHQSQKLAAIDRLVADIAHEINNPNGFIIFNIPILRDYLQELMPIVDRHMKEDPKHRMFGRSYKDFRKDLFNLLDNIEHGSQRINAAVSELKDFSRRREKPGP
jgi:PAS domain S-box-containing protein